MMAIDLHDLLAEAAGPDRGLSGAQVDVIIRKGQRRGHVRWAALLVVVLVAIAVVVFAIARPDLGTPRVVAPADVPSTVSGDEAPSTSVPIVPEGGHWLYTLEEAAAVQAQLPDVSDAPPPSVPVTVPLDAEANRRLDAIKRAAPAEYDITDVSNTQFGAPGHQLNSLEVQLSDPQGDKYVVYIQQLPQPVAILGYAGLRPYQLARTAKGESVTIASTTPPGATDPRASTLPEVLFATPSGALVHVLGAPSGTQDMADPLAFAQQIGAHL
jgi:hypothetical protein